MKLALGVLVLVASQAMARSVPPRSEDGLVKVGDVDREAVRVWVRAVSGISFRGEGACSELTVTCYIASERRRQGDGQGEGRQREG